MIGSRTPSSLPSFPTRRSSDLAASRPEAGQVQRERDRRSPCPSCNPRLDGLQGAGAAGAYAVADDDDLGEFVDQDDRGEAERSEEHTSELQSRENLVCRLLLEK